jgi:hypothetical protein
VSEVQAEGLVDRAIRLRKELAEVEEQLLKENPYLVVLGHPVDFGAKERIEQLELKPNCRSFREYELPMEMVEGGRNRVLFRPYELARVGLHMAGRPQAVLDKMHPEDMWEVANRVMGFIGVAPTTGSGDSPS